MPPDEPGVPYAHVSIVVGALVLALGFVTTRLMAAYAERKTEWEAQRKALEDQRKTDLALVERMVLSAEKNTQATAMQTQAMATLTAEVAALKTEVQRRGYERAA